MSFSIIHNSCKQVLFMIDSTVYAGILLQNGDVISAGDGEVYKADEIEIIEVSLDWIDLTDEIVGDYGL